MFLRQRARYRSLRLYAGVLVRRSTVACGKAGFDAWARLFSQRSKDFNRTRDEIVDELWDMGKTIDGDFFRAVLELSGGYAIASRKLDLQ
jgi:hypothetical protein